MRPFLRRMDRRLAIGALVLVASVSLLSVGLVSIFAAISDDGVELPDEGSLQEILDDSSGDGATEYGAGPDAPAGPPPVRLVIPRLYIDAPVVALGLGDDRYPKVPTAPGDVAWYTFTAAPGVSGNAVFSGHVDWLTRDGKPIPGVFYRLRDLEIGDLVKVTVEEGAELSYRVTGNVATAYDDPNVVKVMQGAGKDVITLITCGGSWVKDYRSALGGNYSHRIIVRAERVSGLLESGAGGG